MVNEGFTEFFTRKIGQDLPNQVSENSEELKTLCQEQYAVEKAKIQEKIDTLGEPDKLDPRDQIDFEYFARATQIHH